MPDDERSRHAGGPESTPGATAVMPPDAQPHPRDDAGPRRDADASEEATRLPAGAAPGPTRVMSPVADSGGRAPAAGSDPADDSRATLYAGAEAAASAEPDPDATLYAGEAALAAAEQAAGPAAPTPAPASPEPAPAAAAAAPSPPSGAELSERRTLAPGAVLFGEYEILDLLGAGGMGEVYQARHRRLGEMRAIKVMHPTVAHDPTAAEFFDREAKALLSVRHPAVVYCHDLLSDEEGGVYLVMEFVDGISLSDRIRNAPLAPEEVRTLGARVASGLAAAHARGVVHLDLSPDNIVLPGGRPEEAKLIDFGIAKVLAAGQQTILDGFKGKLAFASPEQLGFFEGRIDGRSDLYSLGLVLYAAATGHLLPMGETVATAVDSRRELTGLPPDCPAELREELGQLLAFDPAARPESADGLFGGSARVARAAAGGARGPDARGALRWALPGGLIAAALLAAVVWATREPALPPAEPVTLEGEQAPVAPAPAAEPAAVATPEPEAAAPAPAPAAPRPSRTAALREQLRIVGLLRGADAALARDQLTSPPGENAYDKYREVLSIDPGNAEARAGIQRVGGRYIALARDALAKGDRQHAQDYLEQARKVAPRHPDLAQARSALLAASD
jgi:eukaryotic-like serine/threonine-protein kinase